MPSYTRVLALAATANAAFQGFNYGSTFSDGSFKAQDDYESDFKTAQSLKGTNGDFTSARLYTMIQGGTTDTPISAIPAAISTKTSILFGMWASAGQDAFNYELSALAKTIDQYCDQLDGLIAGISVGSEDLYRNSPIGIANEENPGLNPDELVNYIKEVRKAIKGTCMSDAPVGHVDTWTAYDNSSNYEVIDNCDWVGMDAYPYFENTKNNPISQGKSLFQSALDTTTGHANGKPVWITETGWPVSGDVSNKAVASKENAETYWNQVGCPMFGSTNVWWYTLQDSAPTTPNPSFGVVGSSLSSTPLYDLSCSDADDSSSTTSKSEPTTKTTKTKAEETSTTADAQTSKKASTTLKEVSSASASETSSESSSESTKTSKAGSSSAMSSSAPMSTSSSSNSTMSATSMSSVAPSTTVGSGSGSGSGSSETPTTSGSSSETSTSTVPDAGGAQLNSMGAAVAALLIAVAVL